MQEWARQVQQAAEAIDDAIREGADEALTLRRLAAVMGYSPAYATKRFRALAGQTLRDYLRLRRLAFALVEVRDTRAPLLEIALRFGFSSQAAFTRAFAAAYGLSPGVYRRHPVPVVLRSRIRPLDYYLITTGGHGMQQTEASVKTYTVRVPAHRFLHIKNYDSDGYFDFWAKQDEIPGQDCDTICGLLDSVAGKLDGEDGVIGEFSGQIMGYPREADGRIPEAYGVRLPAGALCADSWLGSEAAEQLAPAAGEGCPGRGMPEPLRAAGLQILEVPEGEYLVFEHGPFDFTTQSEAVFEALEAAMAAYRWAGSGHAPDDAPGRIAYYYHDPKRFIKRLLPVKREGR